MRTFEVKITYRYKNSELTNKQIADNLQKYYETHADGEANWDDNLADWDVEVCNKVREEDGIKS